MPSCLLEIMYGIPLALRHAINDNPDHLKPNSRQVLGGHNHRLVSSHLVSRECHNGLQEQSRQILLQTLLALTPYLYQSRASASSPTKASNTLGRVGPVEHPSHAILYLARAWEANCANKACQTHASNHTASPSELRSAMIKLRMCGHEYPRNPSSCSTFKTIVLRANIHP